MKMAEILHKLADLAAAIEGSDPGEPDPKIQNPAELTVVTTGSELTGYKDNSDSPNGTTESGNAKEPEDVFLPPLQQKQELLKKAVGVDNIYDDGTASDQVESEQTDSDNNDDHEDLVAKIKRLSGIPTAAIQELSNDDIVDD